MTLNIIKVEKIMKFNFKLRISAYAVRYNYKDNNSVQYKKLRLS